MIELSEGAMDSVIAGEHVENPIFQILGHKKLASSSSGERYRLLLSDGRRVNSFTMLSTKLNHMISTELTEFTIVQINRYAMSSVNNAGKPKKVMVILNLEVKRPGSKVGGKIGNPAQMEASSETGEPAPAAPPAAAPASRPANNASQRKSLNESVSAGSVITSTPIAALSPYLNRWIIKARVSNKSPIRTWSNSRGEGKLFSVDLVDESDAIRCTGFKEQCDKFFDMIEIGKVYYISRCTLKPANKQFTTLKNDYEMTMNNDTEIVACHDGVDDIPEIAYDFKPLSSVESSEKNSLLDVLGIVKSVEPVVSLMARATGKELRKRDISLVDMSGYQVTLSLWGTQAEEFQGENCPVLAAKSVRIGEFQGGKNLSTTISSMVVIDPDIPEAHRLRGWYDSSGKDQAVKVLSSKSVGGGGGGGMNAPIMTILEGTRKSLEQTDGTETYIVKAATSLIRKDNSFYKSCPTEGCQKKLVDLANGMYKCEKCDREYPNFKYRLLASINLSDWTGNQWATAFNDEAEKLLGVTAQELGELKDSDLDGYDNVFTEASFKSHFFKIRTKLETWNGERRLKAIVGAVGPVDRKMYRDYLMKEFKRLTNVETN